MTHPLCAALREAEERRKAAQFDADGWAHERDETIRAMLAGGCPVREITTAIGLSRERIYQIRDQRR
jgi:hypothetical protein